MDTTEKVAFALAARTAERMRRDHAADKARESVYRCMDQAQRAGLSYVEIAGITGLSLARVGQVLKALRSGKEIA